MILASLFASPAKSEAQAGETGNHHLLWDNTDMLWRCVGSPPGCTSGAS